MPNPEPSSSAVELWGFEFRWRASGSYPLEFRKAGGCRHDWEMVRFDHPLVVALRAATSNPGPAKTCDCYSVCEHRDDCGLSVDSGRSLNARHQEHYRSCNCLGDSSECCVETCECHAENGSQEARP